MNDKYILVGHNPVIEPDLLKWSRWFETANCRIARTTIGEVEISTVFLGIDHSFGFSKKTILFETMVFGRELDGEQERYATWEEAEQGHKEMVDKVMKKGKR